MKSLRTLPEKLSGDKIMFEYEKKIMLTADEYLSFIAPMQDHLPTEYQINYYFDDKELSMNKKGITCRIRAKNGKYKTTVKNHNADNPDCSIEVDLSEKAEFDPLIFNAFGLHYQGELVTERVIMHKDSACEVVVDRNVYLGHTDFEIEVEYCKRNERVAQRIIENIAKWLVATKHLKEIDEFLARIGQEGSKSQRFFERLKNCK